MMLAMTEEALLYKSVLSRHYETQHAVLLYANKPARYLWGKSRLDLLVRMSW